MPHSSSPCCFLLFHGPTALHWLFREAILQLFHLDDPIEHLHALAVPPPTVNIHLLWSKEIRIVVFISRGSQRPRAHAHGEGLNKHIFLSTSATFPLAATPHRDNKRVAFLCAVWCHIC